jgi:hypothetical protein
MFVGWIRDNFESDLEKLSQDLLIDMNLVVKTKNSDSGLIFGIYDGDRLVGVITSYEYEKSILINSFYYGDIDDSYKKRLIKILLNNIETQKSIQVMARSREVEIFEECGFSIYTEFKKAMFNGTSIPFNFSDSMAKSINSENYQKHLKVLTKRAFRDDIYNYITQISTKKSSLYLSNEYCFQHSYAINNNILKISPMIVKEEVYSEAEKLIRGLLHYRGLKKIVAIVPNVDEVLELYKSYSFDFQDSYYLMYKNSKPNINLNTIYAY